MGLDLTISQHTQNVISLIAFGWFIVFMVKATHYYMGQFFPWREKIILFAACGGSFMILFSSQLPWSPLITHQIWSTYALTIAGYVLLDFTVKFRERDDLQNALILPAGFFMFVFGVHDWMLLMQLIPRGDGRLLHFAAPVMVAVFGALLLERFSGVLKRAESHNLELETRVAEKHRELEANYQRLREMENKQLLVNERERFMKEIHDGVGGHLISMLSMVRSGKRDTDIIVSSIEAALSDLRLMIDSLSPQEHDIPSLLGALRTRLEPQMKDSGLNLNWQVEALPAIPDFGPHKALQVLRIVQEAVTNVIRHAEAKNISIKAYAQSEQVIIEVCDDGKGLSDIVTYGKGLNNMRYRAKEIDAEIHVSSGDSSDISSKSAGTCVTLIFDL
jgi:signal transduction histidine kinase